MLILGVQLVPLLQYLNPLFLYAQHCQHTPVWLWRHPLCPVPAPWCTCSPTGRHGIAVPSPLASAAPALGAACGPRPIGETHPTARTPPFALHAARGDRPPPPPYPACGAAGSLPARLATGRGHSRQRAPWPPPAAAQVQRYLCTTRPPEAHRAAPWPSRQRPGQLAARGSPRRLHRACARPPTSTRRCCCPTLPRRQRVCSA
mmetsp:Transcript_43423/g.108850  ORF Transcript_43423/g.108850 Transcript_43423/m.108850 type:complete len:203 (+) Transcript_43423:273-881(+)